MSLIAKPMSSAISLSAPPDAVSLKLQVIGSDLGHGPSSQCGGIYCCSGFSDPAKGLPRTASGRPTLGRMVDWPKERDRLCLRQKRPIQEGEEYDDGTARRKICNYHRRWRRHR
jgi:hypothetical protein